MKLYTGEVEHQGATRYLCSPTPVSLLRDLLSAMPDIGGGRRHHCHPCLGRSRLSLGSSLWMAIFFKEGVTLAMRSDWHAELDFSGREAKTRASKRLGMARKSGSVHSRQQE